MKNQDQAAKVIDSIIRNGLLSPETPGHAIARKLREEGLLATDLPEPDRDSQDTEWQSEYREDYECPAPDVWNVRPSLSVGAFHQDGDVTVWIDGEPLEPFNVKDARKFAYAALAAASRQEQVNDKRLA